MLGQNLDIFGGYFFIRVAIHDFKDYDTIIKTIVLMSIPVAIFMLYEQYSGGYNVFSLLGGVPEMSDVRQGKLRAQGAFSHSIMAGTFGATVLPLSWGLWHRKSRIIPIFGVGTSLVITWASSSSGPIMTLFFCFFGIFLWSFRKHTKTLRNSFFLLIVVLHIVMKAPVWSLISRIDLVGGSTGYFRYRLIDAAIKNFFGWCILGIKSTGVWGWGLVDVTNQYILEGVRGGIIPLILFIIIIVKCYKTIGTSRVIIENKLDLQKYVWSLGVVLFAYTFTFLSVSFFGAMIFFYFLLIAMISSLNNLSVFIIDKES